MLEHWNTHISQSSSGLPDRRRRRGSSRACGVGLCRGTSLSPVFKNVVVSVPMFQPGGDLGRSRWKPAQTHFQAISGLESWNTRRHNECARCSSVPAVGQLGQLAKAAGTGCGNLWARTARSRGFDRHHQIRSGSLVFHQQVGRPASTDRGPGRRSCG